MNNVRTRAARGIFLVFVFLLISTITQAAPPSPPPGQANKPNPITVTLESAADGTGVALDAVTLAAGAQKVFYAVKRNKNGHFIGLATDITWQVAPSNWVAVSTTASAITIEARIAGQAALTGDSTKYGPLTAQVTVTPGAPSSVNIENAEDGSGAAVSTLAPQSAGDLSPPLYAVVRDPFGNYLFTATTDATWSYSGPAGTFTPAGSGVQFSATRVAANHQIRLDYPGLVSSTLSGITITAAAATAIYAESLPDGSGERVTTLSALPAGTPSQPLYAVLRDRFGNYVQTVIDAAWSYTGTGGSFADVAGGKQFSATQAASAQQIGLDYSGLAGSTIDVAITAGPAYALQIESAADGSGGPITTLPAQKAGALSGLLFAIERDRWSNYVGVSSSANWAYADPSGSFTPTAGGVRFSATRAGTNQPITLSAAGLSSATATVTITAEAITQFSVESAGDGGGLVMSSLSLRAGETPSLYAIGRDQYGNFVSPQDAAWSSDAPSGSLSVPNGPATVLSITRAGSYTLTAVHQSLGSRAIPVNIFPGDVTGLSSDAPATATAGACVGVTFTAKDSYGNAASMATDVTLSLTATGSGAWYSDNGCQRGAASADFVQSTSSITLYLSDTIAESAAFTATPPANSGIRSLSFQMTFGASMGGSVDWLTISETHACVITGDTGVSCWGSNSTGELGNNSHVNSLVPVRVLADSSGNTYFSGAKSLSSGHGFSCALKFDGTVWCWGDSDYIANYITPLSSPYTGPIPDTTVPSPVLAGAGTALLTGVTAISSHSMNTLVISDGAVKCFGFNSQWQCGPHQWIETRPHPVPNLGTGVTKIAEGGQVACAIKADKTGWCWGEGALGTDANLKTHKVTEPQQIVLSSAPLVPLTGIEKIVVSDGVYGCAIRTDGTLWCWGNTSPFGMSLPYQWFPVQVWTPTKVVDVGVDSHHTCIIGDDGRVYCNGAGSNQWFYGVLPWPNATYTPLMTLAYTLPSTKRFVSLVSATGNMCAVAEDRSVYCWGRNERGQLLTGDTSMIITPVEMNYPR